MPEVPAKKGRAVLSIPISWRRLGECEHFSVDHERFHNLVRITRVSDLYENTPALHAAHGWLQEALARFDRPRLVLVFDGRRGRLRNDPEFENAMKQVLPALTQGWREFISINNTPVIKMQFLRWSHEGNSAPIRVFNDEGEALNFALEASLSPE